MRRALLHAAAWSRRRGAAAAPSLGSGTSGMGASGSAVGIVDGNPYQGFAALAGLRDPRGAGGGCRGAWRRRCRRAAAGYGRRSPGCRRRAASSRATSRRSCTRCRRGSRPAGRGCSSARRGRGRTPSGRTACPGRRRRGSRPRSATTAPGRRGRRGGSRPRSSRPRRSGPPRRGRAWRGRWRRTSRRGCRAPGRSRTRRSALDHEQDRGGQRIVLVELGRAVGVRLAPARGLARLLLRVAVGGDVRIRALGRVEAEPVVRGGRGRRRGARRVGRRRRRQRCRRRGSRAATSAHDHDADPASPRHLRSVASRRPAINQRNWRYSGEIWSGELMARPRSRRMPLPRA